MINLILLMAIISSALLCLKNKMTADTRKLVKIVAYISSSNLFAYIF